MNKRQVIILSSIAAVLAAAVAIVKFSQKDVSQAQTQRSPGQTLFEAFPASDVANIDISGATGSVTLQKANDSWVVTNRDNYPANVQGILDFLRTVEELKITQAIEAGPSFAPRFGMDEKASDAASRGITATLKNADGKELATISLGKNIEQTGQASPMGGGPMTVGRYIRNHADESAFYASSELFPSVSDEAPRWLKDEFISPEKIQTITLTNKDSKDVEWSLTRDTEEAEFKLVGAAADEVANSTNTGPLKALFSYARFDDVVPAVQVKSRLAESGTRSATLVTFEGFTYNVEITPAVNSAGQFLMKVSVNAELPTERKKAEGETAADAKTKDEAFAKRLKTLQDKLSKAKSFEGRVFEINPSTVEGLLKERKDMVTKATAAPAPATGNGTPPPALQRPN